MGGSVPLVDEAVPCGSDLLDSDEPRLRGGDVDGGAGFQRYFIERSHVELLDGLLTVGQGAGIALGSPVERFHLPLLQDRVLEIHGRQIFHGGIERLLLAGENGGCGYRHSKERKKFVSFHNICF